MMRFISRSIKQEKSLQMHTDTVSKLIQSLKKIPAYRKKPSSI